MDSYCVKPLGKKNIQLNYINMKFTVIQKVMEIEHDNIV